MSTWQQMIQASTLGLNRSPFSEELEESWLKEIDLPEAIEPRILQLAGTLALARKAGYQPIKLKTQPSTPVPLDEILPYISPSASQSLARILNGSSKELFAEIISLILNADKIIPPEYLPKLFQWAIHSKMASEVILEVSGNRGQWLASLNPDWKIFLPPLLSQWESGKFEERLAYFAWKRRIEPNDARELLEEIYQEETPQNLAKLIELLDNHLSKEDLVFLESVENHRRKEVRIAARRLLTKVNGSQITERIKARLVEIIILQKKPLGGVLEINPLDNIDEALQKDGIDGRISSGLKLGKRAAVLGQMIGTISPDFWEHHFGHSVESILKMALKSEWAEALIYGFGQACINYKNAHWAAGLIKLLTDDLKTQDLKKVESILKPHIPEILHLVNHNELNQIIHQAIKKIRHPDHNLNGLYLLEHLRTPIAAQNAVLFAQRVIDLLDTFGNRLDYSFRAFVYEMAKTTYCFPPEIFSQIANIWGLNPYQTNWYDPHIDRALQLLQLRNRMKKEI